MSSIYREKALDLLKKYNKDPFHIQHAITVEAVMKWYAGKLGYGEAADSLEQRVEQVRYILERED